ncbi:hypothetical protein GBA52_022639 [Prunus armeniaca]|nr:hypothetical protein GBA52_022639 [Prunus armeniaca]
MMVKIRRCLFAAALSLQHVDGSRTKLGQIPKSDTVTMPHATVCSGGPTRHVLLGWIVGVDKGPTSVWCTASLYASAPTATTLQLGPWDLKDDYTPPRIFSRNAHVTVDTQAQSPNHRFANASNPSAMN